MSERSSIFDMIGPVMIGPSSSHTAGVVRIGRVARRVLGGTPSQVVITFYNSFATTYEGHGSDSALDLATQAGLSYKFRSVGSASKHHPNSIRVTMHAPNGHTAEVLGVSRGGGLILIEEVDGFHCHFTAQTHTLIVEAQDVPGAISFITTVLRHDGVNIATMTVSRTSKNGAAKHVIECDSGLRPLTLQYLQSIEWIQSVLYIPDIDL
jgi:L-serine dehydratase